MNIRNILRDWTLPVAMLCGTLSYLLFAYTPALSSASALLEPLFVASMPLCMFLILFVTFCKVDFHQMRPEGWHLRVAVAQLTMVAMVTLAILTTFDEGEKKVMCEGVLMCIIGPTASAAAVVTTKLGGNLGSMTTYTFISNFLTALLIPTLFPLIEKSADITFAEAFIMILQRVAVVLVLPLLCAYVVRHWIPSLQARIVSVRDLGFYLWAFCLAVVTGTTVKSIVHSSASLALLTAIAVSSLAVCALQFLLGKRIGKPYDSSINAGQALGQKNTTFAIWIAYTYLNPVSSIGPGCYILWQNIVNSLELWQARKPTPLA